jgi:hypothetical protein
VRPSSFIPFTLLLFLCFSLLCYLMMFYQFHVLQSAKCGRKPSLNVEYVGIWKEVVMAWGLLRQYLPEDAEEAYESPHSG